LRYVFALRLRLLYNRLSMMGNVDSKQVYAKDE